MKTKILFLLTFLILICCKEKELTPLVLANQIVNKYENQKSLSYEIDYKIKYFSEIGDTTKVSAKIDLIRQSNDSIFGGYVWIKSDSIERYYNTQNTYFIDHRNQSITKYQKEDYFVITGNTLGEAMNVYFLKPERLVYGASDTTINIIIKDENLNGNKHWKLAYQYEDDGVIKNTRKNIWIRKENMFISKVNFSSDLQGENQYNQWDLSGISYNNVSVDDLELRFDAIRQKYDLEDYKQRTKEELSLLANGTKMPELKGIQYFDRAKVSLSDYQGKLVLLDFWYMDCFPCIKSIPHLNELYNKYKEKGLVVVGANPYDGKEQNLKRMPNFLSNNTIDYPIMFIDEKNSKEFKIQVYPSFYLVDKQGKVIHSEMGFSEERTNIIDSLIQINL